MNLFKLQMKNDVNFLVVRSMRGMCLCTARRWTGRYTALACMATAHAVVTGAFVVCSKVFMSVRVYGCAYPCCISHENWQCLMFANKMHFVAAGSIHVMRACILFNKRHPCKQSAAQQASPV